MSRLHRLSFSERRRRTLAMRVAEIERMEARSTVTPLSVAALAAGSVPVAAQLGGLPANGAGHSPALAGATSRPVPPDQARAPSTDTGSIAIDPRGSGQGQAGALPDLAQAGDTRPVNRAGDEDAIDFIRSLG